MMFEWVHLHEAALWWIGILSAATFVGTLIVIPILVVRIPADYFIIDRQNPDRWHGQRSLIHFLAVIIKNLLGLMFVVAGLAMLMLPGQGFITILIGIMLLNFPGKLALELRIIRQPVVLRTINWMRARANKPALEVPGPALRRRDKRGKR